MYTKNMNGEIYEVNNSLNTVNGGSFDIQYQANDSGLQTTHYCGNCFCWHYNWWPVAWCYHAPERDKTAEAFKIIQKLIELKVIKEIRSVNKFIELVGEISKIL
jgi:hypothetical protein